MAEELVDSLVDRDLTPATRLLIGRPSTSPSGRNLCFRNHKTVGSFAIDKEKKYVKDQQPPTLKLPGRLSNLNIDLNDGKEDADLIANYNDYGSLKHDYFYKWLLDDYLTSDGGPFAHDFIGFCGRFAEMLKTPFLRFNNKFRNGEWQIHAVKFNGSIFLLNAMPTLDSQDLGDPLLGLYGYYGRRFEHILTCGKNDDQVDEYSQTFIFRQCDFGKHKLLCLRWVDAVDDKQTYVEIKTYGRPWDDWNMKNLRMHYWATSVPAGIESLVLGKRSKDGILENIKICRTKDLTTRNNDIWNSSTCYEFANRMLDWIKSHFVENEPTVVKQFRWRVGMEEVEMVECPDVDVSGLFMPEWFVKGVEGKRKGTR